MRAAKADKLSCQHGRPVLYLHSVFFSPLHFASLAVGRGKHMLTTICDGRAHCGSLGCRPFVSLMFCLIFLQLKIGWLIGWRPEPSKPLLLSVFPRVSPTISERWPSVQVCGRSHCGGFFWNISVCCAKNKLLTWCIHQRRMVLSGAVLFLINTLSVASISVCYWFLICGVSLCDEIHLKIPQLFSVLAVT